MAEENNFTRNRFLLQTFNCNSNSVRIRWAALVWVKNNPFVCSGGSSRGAEGAPTEGARGERGVRGVRGRRLGREVQGRGSAGAWRAAVGAQRGPSSGPAGAGCCSCCSWWAPVRPEGSSRGLSFPKQPLTSCWGAGGSEGRGLISPRALKGLVPSSQVCFFFFICIFSCLFLVL